MLIDWRPEYAGGLSNHLPMAIQALQSMGASQAQTLRLTEHVSKRLEKLAAPVPNNRLQNWQQVESIKGQHSQFYELREFFLEQLNNQTSQKKKILWINNCVQSLLPGISGAAFHPLIRLGHALSTGSNYAQNKLTSPITLFEIASSLAYWVYAYAELTWPKNNYQCSDSLASTIDQLLTDTAWPTGRLGNKTIADDMLKVKLQSNFDKLVFQPKASNIRLEEIESAILKLYLATNDFAILHGVTATHAVRVIQAYRTGPSQILMHLWQALVSVYLAKGFTSSQQLKTLTQLKDIDIYHPEEIRQRACNSLDSHSIKLVATCLEMFQLTANNDYLLAASRKLQQDKSAVI